MVNHRKKIEIIDVDINVDLTKDFNAAKDLSNIKDKIKSLAEVANMRVQKKATRKSKIKEYWTPKLESLYDALNEHPDKLLSKTDVLKATNVPESDLGPFIMRFKAYLRKELKSKYVLNIYSKSGMKYYNLMPFGTED